MSRAQQLGSEPKKLFQISSTTVTIRPKAFRARALESQQLSGMEWMDKKVEKSTTKGSAIFRSSRPKTRERILVVSLALLNERGSTEVTTAEIAAAVEIAEGNLHYHFRRKADLLTALFALFEADVDALIAHVVDDHTPTEVLAMLQLKWFRLMWDHRWFYRNTSGVFAEAPLLVPRVRTMTVQNRQFVTANFKQMIERKLLVVSPEQLELLLTNVWIVTTFWIDFRRFLTGRSELDQADFGWGYEQVASLYAPFLSKKGKDCLTTPPVIP